jgi:GNAT superfamily N-acetyltransferase
MNPLERLVTSLVNAVLGIVQALISGILGAPATAARKAVGPVDVERAPAARVIDLRHRVLRAGRPRETAHFDGDDEDRTRHWVAGHQGEVIGVVTVLARPFPDGDGPGWQLRGMATDPAWRGRGVGRALLRAVEAEVAEPMWCNARTGAAPFYEKHGWRRAGETFEIAGVGPHVRMIRDLPPRLDGTRPPGAP